MSDVHRELCQVFERLAAQFEACFGEFKRSVSRDVVRELAVLGGAGATHGLLRFLRCGR